MGSQLLDYGDSLGQNHNVKVAIHDFEQRMEMQKNLSRVQTLHQQVMKNLKDDLLHSVWNSQVEYQKETHIQILDLDKQHWAKESVIFPSQPGLNSFHLQVPAAVLYQFF
ncbi:hypothetical protein AAHE18_18G168000 [Arachis hypogaea]